MAKLSLDELNKLNYYDLWCAACVIFPGLNNFTFMNGTEGNLCRKKGIALVKSMVASSMKRDGNLKRTSATPLRLQAEPIVSNDLGSNAFSLSDSFSFLVSQRTEVSDEVDEFLNEKISKEDCDGLKNNNKYILKYWFDREKTYPNLSKVAIRILATPASSASSERDFSLWKLINSPLRSCLDASLAENIAISKSSIVGDM